MNEALAILPQVLADGLVLGFVYAMVAIGYTMVYGVLEFINFAHSEIFMVGAFIGVEVLILLLPKNAPPLIPNALAVIAAILAAMILSAFLGALIERTAYRPLRNAPRLVPLISAIGVSFFLQDIVRILQGLINNDFYRRPPEVFADASGSTIMVKFGESLAVPQKSFWIIGICLLTMVILTQFVNRTRLGKAIRAVAQDRPTASLMGINVDAIITLTFFIGAGLGGVAGVLYAMQYNIVHPFIGFIFGLKAFTAAVFGGIGNIPGAMVGGVLLGLIEALGSAYLGMATGGAFGAEYQDVFAFAILIMVLIFKPSGLLGEIVREKV